MRKALSVESTLAVLECFFVYSADGVDVDQHSADGVALVICIALTSE